jgi:phosphoglycolate phosphatase
MHNLLKNAEIVIWDWNGTLLDDVDVCIAIINDSLRKRGLAQIGRTDYLDLFEFPVINYYRKLGFDFSRESFQDIGMEFIRAYGKAMFECSLQPGSLQLLESLRRAGKRQFILSALEVGSLNRVIRHYQLETFFTDTRGLDHHYADGKVELGKALLGDHHHDPQKAVMIGDTLHDLETAQALGISCILTTTGHNSPARLRASGAPVTTGLSELLNLLETP